MIGDWTSIRAPGSGGLSHRGCGLRCDLLLRWLLVSGLTFGLGPGALPGTIDAAEMSDSADAPSAPAGSDSQATSVPYTISISDVREVCLLGRGDAAFWTAELEPEGLGPRLENGYAQMLLCAFDSRWMGWRFQETLLAVFVEAEPAGEASFLSAALSSRPLFAWVERKRNRSPYQVGTIRLAGPGGEVGLWLMQGRKPVVTASLGPREDGWVEQPRQWEGHVKLASRLGKRGPEQYRVRLRGTLQVRAFDPTLDRFGAELVEGSALARCLSASRFEPQEWQLSADGAHARSDNFLR